MGYSPKTTLRFALVAMGFAVVALTVSICLHEYHYTFDPYSWANPEIESDKSRDLWNERKDLYRFFIAVFFLLTMGLSGISWMVWRRFKKKTAEMNK